ncbi:MAG: methyltransferase [Alphaproteobacteria bacterium]|nr:methyltransferase [Alphaproteobacteria bacterium]
MSDPIPFVLANTRLDRTPLLPEISLHLASQVTPLWEATEATLQKEGLPPPYWAFAWVGGQAVARHLLDHPEIVRGLRVLDFAAGSGVAGIAAALAGAALVEAAEIDAFAGAAISLNASANGVAVSVFLEDLVGSKRRWDVVLAGDVCYERPMAERVFDWLLTLQSQGARILLGDPGRAYLPQSGLALLGSYDVPTTRDIEDKDMRTAKVYEVLATL